MIHFRIIHRILGVLLLIESGIMMACALIPLFYGEDDLFGFIMASLMSACCGMALAFAYECGLDTIDGLCEFTASILLWRTGKLHCESPGRLYRMEL